MASGAGLSMRRAAASVPQTGDADERDLAGHMTAADLGRAIGAGRIHPVELAEAFLEAIDAHPLGDPHLRPRHPRPRPGRGDGRRRARQGRAAPGPAGRGAAVSWKDLFDTAGVATEAGSALLKGRIPARDAEVLAAGDAQGLVCLGKTHMSELAFSGLGLNPVTATPPCVNDDRSGAGRVVLGGGGLGRLRAGPGRHRVGHRRIGAHSGGVERSGRAEDHVGAAAADGHGAAVREASTRSARWPIRSRIARFCWPRWKAGRPPTWPGPLAGARLLVLETVALDDLRPARRWRSSDRLARLAARRGQGGAAGRAGSGRVVGGVAAVLHRRGLWHLARDDRGRAREDVSAHSGTVPLWRDHSRPPTMSPAGAGCANCARSGPTGLRATTR